MCVREWESVCVCVCVCVCVQSSLGSDDATVCHLQQYLSVLFLPWKSQVISRGTGNHPSFSIQVKGVGCTRNISPVNDLRSGATGRDRDKTRLNDRWNVAPHFHHGFRSHKLLRSPSAAAGARSWLCVPHARLAVLAPWRHASYQNLRKRMSRVNIQSSVRIDFLVKQGTRFSEAIVRTRFSTDSKPSITKLKHAPAH